MKSKVFQQANGKISRARERKSMNTLLQRAKRSETGNVGNERAQKAQGKRQNVKISRTGARISIVAKRELVRTQSL